MQSFKLCRLIRCLCSLMDLPARMYLPSQIWTSQLYSIDEAAIV